jgi:TonB family protein
VKWERFTYYGEEFSVELPEMPFVHDTSRHVNRTRNDYEEMRVFGVYAGGVVFMVASYERPRDSETFDDFAAYPWGVSLGGLASKGNVTLKGFAGKEYELAGGLGGARVFRAQKRAYLVWARSRDVGHPSVARFLDSLALEESPRGTRITRDAAVASAQSPTAAFAVPPLPIGSNGPGRGGGVGSVEPTAATPSAPAPNPEGPFRQAEVTRKAVIVYKPAPGYTEEARRNNVTGVVRLRVVLSSSGKVTNIAVVKGLPDGLTEKAISASRRMLFFPAGKGGREVSQFVILEYNFNIY